MIPCAARTKRGARYSSLHRPAIHSIWLATRAIEPAQSQSFVFS